MLVNKLAIIGVGLIGGSLARALKESNQCNQISGFGRNRANLEKAVELGVIDDFSDDINKVVVNADIIMLATPLSSYVTIFESILPHLSEDTIVTDAGSVKGSVVASARSILNDGIGKFIPGHPIAGTEKSGVEASFARLYEDHVVILTPIPENSADDLQKITAMWEACGANVVNIPVDYHDKVLAATSHLPHVLAYALVDCLANIKEEDDVFRFSAGGFRDFTRIAASNPEMWSDICLANKKYLLEIIGDYNKHLKELTRLIKSDDLNGLKDLFAQVKSTRDKLS